VGAGACARSGRRRGRLWVCGYEVAQDRAGTLPGNDASVRVLEKLGFCDEGTRRDYLYLEGRFHGCRFFSLLATDQR
jgi:[ribosomal protein S5]-alanine N-acetyltransferase